MKLLRREGVATQHNSYTLTTVILLMALFVTGCVKSDVPAAPESVVFTLYTNPPSDPYWRTNIATFDWYVSVTPEYSEARNKRHCDEVAVLLQSNWLKITKSIVGDDASKVRHWCEKGRFKK